MFKVLGTLELDFPGECVEIGAAKQRAVLAVLLLRAGRPVGADRLIAEVWGDAPPPTARTSLRTYVYRLRRTLAPLSGPGLRLATRGRSYVLSLPEDALDVSVFQRSVAAAGAAMERGDAPGAAGTLRSALEMWRGPVLPELDLELVRQERHRLEEARGYARELWLEAELGCGRHRQAVPALERFVAAHPFRENVWAMLVRALWMSGRRADALAAYRRVRALLAEELGVDPSGELERLHQDILSGREP
ncbi:BTAD domain-containing putative transcriptional regulator [Nonomuraea sp. NPDC023979]|uniref:AfsR/SARP family transcriptional regulator n=1 Tax=Nonomuraea sp. NPDC023979 TaxID=3154796 RepID=UPI0033CBC00D